MKKKNTSRAAGKASQKLILISNDDGVYSSGIRALAAALRTISGVRVVVVAPDREQSATSHALTVHRPLRITALGDDFFAVDGTPTDAVSLAIHTILKRKPDLVVSGINKGLNLGEDVHYSGTVAAAMEGAIFGVPSVAISQAGEEPFSFKAASRFAVRLVKSLLKRDLPPGILLNVNVPAKVKSSLPYMIASQGRHNTGGVIIKNLDPRGRPYYWIGVNLNGIENRPGTDCHAFLKNKISITPIKVDLTDTVFLEELSQWRI